MSREIKKLFRQVDELEEQLRNIKNNIVTLLNEQFGNIGRIRINVDYGEPYEFQIELGGKITPEDMQELSLRAKKIGFFMYCFFGEERGRVKIYFKEEENNYNGKKTN